MGKYKIQYNFNASIIVDVDAKDEGEALDKGRNIAEEADDDTIKHYNEWGLTHEL